MDKLTAVGQDSWTLVCYKHREVSDLVGKRVDLIHWKEAEAPEKVATLKQAGFEVRYQPPDRQMLKEIRANIPDAFVIDLSRLPSHGRDIAVGLRSYKSTRFVPLIFVGGAKEKVAAIRKLLPDVTFTEWNDIKRAVEQAIAKPVRDPIVPESVMAVYAGTPLPKKLGIGPDMCIVLVNAPADFENQLGKTPSGTSVKRQLRGKADLIIWFLEDRNVLERDLLKVAGHLTEKGGIWIAWPKKASGVKSDLSQVVVRKIGLAAGLVDHKVCSIDDTWSGLRFVWRKCRR